jgi:hypothetical protein
MHMATFQQVLNKALSEGKTQLVSVNRNLMEIASATKKKPGYLKVATPEDLVKGLMMNKQAAFVLFVDGDHLNEIAAQIDKDTESTESA